MMSRLRRADLRTPLARRTDSACRTVYAVAAYSKRAGKQKFVSKKGRKFGEPFPRTRSVPGSVHLPSTIRCELASSAQHQRCELAPAQGNALGFGVPPANKP